MIDMTSVIYFALIHWQNTTQVVSSCCCIAHLNENLNRTHKVSLSEFYFHFYFFVRNRLAALEIARFQDQLIERITTEMTAQLESGGSPQTGAVMLLQPTHGGTQEYNWTFARSFLYSLTVLTTIGECVNGRTGLGSKTNLKVLPIGWFAIRIYVPNYMRLEWTVVLYSRNEIIIILTIIFEFYNNFNFIYKHWRFYHI